MDWAFAVVHYLCHYPWKPSMASRGHLLHHPDVPQRTTIHLWDHTCNPSHEVKSEPKNSKGAAVTVESHGLLEENTCPNEIITTTEKGIYTLVQVLYRIYILFRNSIAIISFNFFKIISINRENYRELN